MRKIWAFIVLKEADDGGIDFGCLGMMLVVVLIYLAVIVAAIPLVVITAVLSTIIHDVGEGVVKGAHILLLYVIPVICMLIAVRIVFSIEPEYRKELIAPAIVTIIHICLLSVLLHGILPYRWVPIWTLLRFKTPLSAFYFGYWGVRLLYNIVLAFLLRNKGWHIISKVRSMNGCSNFLVIFQLTMWSVLSGAQFSNNDMMFVLLAPLTVFLWFITNIPIRRIVRNYSKIQR